jgi:hypothetical protein
LAKAQKEEIEAKSKSKGTTGAASIERGGFFHELIVFSRRSKMDTNDATNKPKMKTEDYFPGASSAWSNAWCMDHQSFSTHEEEGHPDYGDHEEPEAGWDRSSS